MSAGSTGTRQALVTGGGNGIGEGIARALAGAGYAVAVVDRDGAAAARVAADLPHAQAIAADVTDEASIERAFAALSAAPDLVVCNAGIVRFGPLLTQSIQDLRSVLDVNLWGAMLTALAGARRMAAGRGGHVVCITSINSETPGPNVGAYPAAKAGLAHFAKQLAIECGPSGVRVNAVSPGFIDGGISAPIYADEAVRVRRAGSVPLRRLGTVEDVANAVLWLDSPGASYISGHELVVDGGVVGSLLAQLPRT